MSNNDEQVSSQVKQFVTENNFPWIQRVPDGYPPSFVFFHQHPWNTELHVTHAGTEPTLLILQGKLELWYHHMCPLLVTSEPNY
jgi:hypothetical protein